ncbi:carbohydrate sulfotransferase 1-like isoform X1 [Mercenaria mercenaria]|uniref:carbohydrate sulfotransferase 1-like isoform X1 n=1 Tax=Mercenaria mercenaria TaxID=6596 RepID=UPI00234FA0B7|nr:carbohydrate sulfotransferase 1-like isoform X1 [Mercenaria mercenaria]
MVSKKYSLLVCASCLLIYLALLLFETETRSKTNSRASSTSSPFINIAGLFNSIGLQSKFNPDPSQPVSVLVLTYMRSGSSLTGDILQQSDGAFYVYEPFRSLGHKNASTFTISYANGTERQPPFSFNEETYNALYNWFTCNISRLANIGLMDGFLNKGLKSRMFPICYRKEMQNGKDQKLAIRMCARELQGICENSPFRIIKTIRIQLQDIRNLLEDLPNLKIVHLVRDPRATLSSQASLGMCSSRRGGQPGCTNKFCKRLENDVLAEERLMKLYPNRIMPVFYEDIAKHPLQTSKKMYDFIGAEFTLEAEAYIYNITMAGLANNCVICTTRSNSSEHVDTWKTKMKPEFINIVNERCNYVIKRYNFDEFPVT